MFKIYSIGLWAGVSSVFFFFFFGVIEELIYIC